MEKQCSKCSEVKPLKDFNKKSSNKDGYEGRCKRCTRAEVKSSYIKNKEYYFKRNFETRFRNAKLIDSIKDKLRCSVCGESRNWVLDFHHPDSSKKEGQVSTLIINNSINKALKEIEKCVVLCSNCHRDLHYKERNSL